MIKKGKCDIRPLFLANYGGGTHKLVFQKTRVCIEQVLKPNCCVVAFAKKGHHNMYKRCFAIMRYCFCFQKHVFLPYPLTGLT